MSCTNHVIHPRDSCICSDHEGAIGISTQSKRHVLVGAERQEREGEVSYRTGYTLNLRRIQRPAATDLEIHLTVVTIHCPRHLNGVIRKGLTIIEVSGRHCGEVSVPTLREREERLKKRREKGGKEREKGREGEGG